MATQSSFDAIIIGGGHNGLITAGYLQKSGLNTLVLESRSMVGGACVTEEVFPGYHVSTTSYVCSLLRPKIIKELELEKHGLSFIERSPSSFTPYEDDRYLIFWGDKKKTCEEIAKFSKKDAENYLKYEETLSRLAEFVEPILMMTPPDPLSNNLGSLLDVLKLGLKARGLEEDLYNKLRILSQSATDYLDRWFESDQLKSTLSTDGIIGAFASPSTPGTAYVLLHHVMGETFGKKGVWAYVKGGMGQITQSMVRSFESKGGTIHTQSPVKKIIVKDGSAVGVALKSGQEFYAPTVISSADPKKTFLNLVDSSALESSFLDKVKQIRYRSATFKLNLALNGVPNWKALPHSGSAGLHHRGTMHVSPSVSYIEKAFQDTQAGKMSEQPVLECTMASVLDPSIAPEGKHIMSIFAQYAPYELKNGTWNNETKKEFANRCYSQIEKFAPGFKNLIEHEHLLSPKDLEDEYGLTGGNVFHGEMTLDQLFFMRPLPECARYRTPVKNLYLCGSGTHPGGGVMGACGHNAAREILKDNKKRFY